MADKIAAAALPEVASTSTDTMIVVRADNTVRRTPTPLADLASAAAGKGAELLSFKQVGTGAVQRTQYDKNLDVVSVMDFMSDAQRADARAFTYTLDCTAAINAALAAHRHVTIPEVGLRIDGTLNVTLQGQSFTGPGAGSAFIRSYSANLPSITIADGLANIDIGGFTLVRAAAAASGGHGIQCSTATLGQTSLHDMLIERQWIGLALGSTDYSDVRNVIVQRCYSHGVYITNPSATAAQWSMHNVISQLNAGYGFLVESQPTAAFLSVGTWRAVNTYANTLGGIWVLGSAACKIEGFRLDGFFVGEDGNHGLYLDAYGTGHTIRNGFAEIIGTSLTGPDFATAASHVGNGILVTANNGTLDLSNVYANGNEWSGIHLSGTAHNVIGCTSINNGAALVAGKRYGLHLAAGRAVINGGFYGNTSTTAQLYGIVAADGNNLSVVGADLTGNVTGNVIGLSNDNKVTLVGCLPNTERNQIQGGLVMGTATGGNLGAGTINVATDVKKNNTTYTNP